MEQTAPVNAIVAVNPQQMADARRSTAAWIEAKLAAANADREQADAIYDQMVTARLNAAPAKAALNKAAKRVRFYEKVQQAIALGYYIVPPFDVQLFAVRVNRKANAQRNRQSWPHESKGQALAVDDGRYVNPQIPRIGDGYEKDKDYKGETQAVQLYRNGNFRDEINLPVRAMKPTIIDAVGRALQEKVFDALGIAPQYRAADPIICGRINKPSGGHLTFLVAWWLDADDLDA